MRIRPLITVAIATTVLSLGACGSSDTSGSPPTTTTSAAPPTTGGATGGGGSGAVAIADFAFAPDDLEVHTGDTVTFRNDDDATHTATSTGAAPDRFDTGDIAGGSSAEVTFDRSGDYAYQCSIHEYMKGTIRVIG